MPCECKFIDLPDDPDAKCQYCWREAVKERNELRQKLDSMTAERDQARKTSAWNKENHLHAEAEVLRLRAQVDKEHECAEELKEGLCKQFAESAKELDAKDGQIKSLVLQVEAFKKAASKSRDWRHHFRCKGGTQTECECGLWQLWELVPQSVEKRNDALLTAEQAPKLSCPECDTVVICGHHDSMGRCSCGGDGYRACCICS